MSALTAERDTRVRAGVKFHFALVAAAKAYKGGLAALVNGEARPAADAANLRVVGVFSETVDNTVDGLGVEVGVEISRFDNSATHPVTAASLFKYCYVEDDQTVSADPGDHAVKAGIPVAIDDDGVWIQFMPVAISENVTPTYAAPAAVTYVAPAGGATVDAEGRAAIVQIAADNVATRAALAKTAADNAAIIAALKAGGLMA